MKAKTAALFVLLLGAGLASPLPAAEEWYLGGRIGVEGARDPTLDAGPILAELEPDTGWNFGLRLGLRTMERYRFEVEWSRAQSEAEALTGLNLDRARGDVVSSTVLVNALVEWPIEGSALRPYLGAGVGFGRLELDGIEAGFLRLEAEDEGSPAVQGIVGVEVALDPRLGFALDARFLQAEADELEVRVLGQRFDGESRYRALSVNAVLRWSF